MEKADRWSIVSLRISSCSKWSRRSKIKVFCFMLELERDYMFLSIGGQFLGGNSSRICRIVTDYRSDDSGTMIWFVGTQGRAFWWWLDDLNPIYELSLLKIQISMCTSLKLHPWYGCQNSQAQNHRTGNPYEGFFHAPLLYLKKCMSDSVLKFDLRKFWMQTGTTISSHR